MLFASWIIFGPAIQRAGLLSWLSSSSQLSPNHMQRLCRTAQAIAFFTAKSIVLSNLFCKIIHWLLIKPNSHSTFTLTEKSSLSNLISSRSLVQYRSNVSWQSRLETRSSILDVFENRGSSFEMLEEFFKKTIENRDRKRFISGICNNRNKQYLASCDFLYSYFIHCINVQIVSLELKCFIAIIQHSLLEKTTRVRIDQIFTQPASGKWYFLIFPTLSSSSELKFQLVCCMQIVWAIVRISK